MTGVINLFSQTTEIGKTQIAGIETANWPNFRFLLNIENVRDLSLSELQSWNFEIKWGSQLCAIKNTADPAQWLKNPAQVILIVDNSTSMRGKTPFVEQAYKIFIDGIRENMEVSIIRFQQPNAAQPWASQFIVQTSNSQYFMKEQNIFSTLTSRTYLYDAVYQSLSFFDNFIKAQQKSVVVLSDGNDVGSSVGFSTLVQRAEDLSIPLFFIDFSSEKDRNKKARDLISETYGFYAASSNPKELSDIYYTILTKINNLVVLEAEYPIGESKFPPTSAVSVKIWNANTSVSISRDFSISLARVEELRYQHGLSDTQNVQLIDKNASADRGMYRDDNWFNLGLAAIRDGKWEIVTAAMAALAESRDVFAAERAKLLNIGRAEAQQDPQLNTIYIDYYRQHSQGIFVDKILWKLILWNIDQKDETETLKWITVLRREYPWSKYCDDAIMYMAKREHDASNYSDAEKLYLDIKLFYDRSDQYGQSLLKLSDMYIEQQAYAKAEEFLSSVERDFVRLAEGGALYQNLALSQYLQKKYLDAARTVDRFSQRLPESSELASAKLLQGSIYGTYLFQPEVGKNIFAGLFSDDTVPDEIRAEAQAKYNELVAGSSPELPEELATKTPEDSLLLALMQKNGWVPGADLPLKFLDYAEFLISENQPEPALQLTTAVANEYPVAGIADRAMLQTSLVHRLRNNHAAEVQTLTLLLDEYPSSKRRWTTLHHLALAYRDLGNYRLSLNNFETLLSEADETYPDYQKAASEYSALLAKAVVLVEGKLLNIDPAELEKVNISVYEISADSTASVAIVNDSGGYRIALPLRKRYTLIATAPGYLLYTADLDFRELLSSDTLKRDIALKTLEKNTSAPLENIGFDFNSSTLNSESLPTLRAMIRFLKDNQNLEVEIAGHTDNVGDPDFNDRLSLNRALSVARYLLENGVSLKNVTTQGYGSRFPLASNETEEGRAINRRVELKVMK